MSLTIRKEKEADHAAIHSLYERAFEGDLEATLVDELRAGRYLEIAIVADHQGEIIGHIAFSRASIMSDDGRRTALALAPMAVDEPYRGKGIGTALVETGLLQAKQRDFAIVTVLGHPEFYNRFGFDSELAKQVRSAFGGGDAWMALELDDGALADVAGDFEYAPPFLRFA